MKAWKYGLALLSGLSVSGCGTQGFAQTATGLSGPVVPKHAVPMPEPSASDTAHGGELAFGGLPEEDMPDPIMPPENGVAPPQVVTDLVQKGEYAAAAEEFERFVKTEPGELCMTLYARMVFYEGVMMADTANAVLFKARRDSTWEDLQKQCPDLPDVCIKQAFMAETPAEEVHWFSKAIKAGAEYHYCYAARAEALWELGKTKKACADYKKAADLKDPGARVAYRERCLKISRDAKGK